MRCAVVVFLGSSAAAIAADGDDVVGNAGTISVTVSDLQKLLKSLPPETRQQILSSPASLHELANAQLTRKLVLAEVKAKKLEDKPEIVEQLERARGDVLVNAYLNQAVPASSIAEPNEEEVKQLYAANKNSLMAPRQLRVSQIFVAVEQSAETATQNAAKAKIDDLSKKLKKGSDFAELARTSSDHTESKDKGGDLGFLPEDNLLPVMRQTVGTMKPGDVSEPIRSPTGWHIVKLVEIKPSTVRPFADVRVILVNTIKQQRLEAARQAHISAMLDKAQPIVLDHELQKVTNGLK